MSEKYALCPPFWENTSIHCTTLAVSETLIKEGENVKVGQPDENSRNGTLTFVKSNGKVYGITCWHVVEYLRILLAESGDDHSHSLFTMSPRPYMVMDRFIRPQSLTEYHELDVVIREVHPDMVKGIGKEPIDIDTQLMPGKVEFGVAVGFPEGLKYVKEKMSKEFKQVISMPTVSILAEIDSMPEGRFNLYSEFDEPHLHDSYSGMSGGPIFWNRPDAYGIFGITYEASKFETFGSDRTIMIAGELATPDEIRHWISQIPESVRE
jgi:hypothetical protein